MLLKNEKKIDILLNSNNYIKNYKKNKARYWEDQLKLKSLIIKRIFKILIKKLTEKYEKNNKIFV